MAEEQTAAHPAKGGAFSKKYGPLPLWGWMGLGLAGALGFAYLRGGGSSNAANTAAAQQQAAQQAATAAQQAAQTPPYVTQNYGSATSTTTGTPAPAPASAPPTPPHHRQGRHAASAGTAPTQGTTGSGTTSQSSPQSSHPQSSQPWSPPSYTAQGSTPRSGNTPSQSSTGPPSGRVGSPRGSGFGQGHGFTGQGTTTNAYAQPANVPGVTPPGYYWYNGQLVQEIGYGG